MTKIENVSGSRSESLHYRDRLALNCLRRRQQDSRVKISLQRDARSDACSCKADIDSPVEANCIAAGVGDTFEPAAAAFGKNYIRNALAAMFAFQAGNDLLHIGQREFVIGGVR